MTTDADSPLIIDADAPDELAQLRAENAELRARVQRGEHRGPRPTRNRNILVGMLVVFAAIAFTGASVGVWVRRSLLNNDVFAARVVPLAKDPAVQAAISTKMTDEIFTLVNPQALFQQVLPERGQILAGPLSNAVKGFVGDQVTGFVASDTFAQLW